MKKFLILAALAFLIHYNGHQGPGNSTERRVEADYFNVQSGYYVFFGQITPGGLDRPIFSQSTWTIDYVEAVK
jgi:hypothetical protein